MPRAATPNVVTCSSSRWDSPGGGDSASAAGTTGCGPPHTFACWQSVGNGHLAVDDALELTRAEFAEGPEADLRLTVPPGFYERVAGFHCEYRD